MRSKFPGYYRPKPEDCALRFKEAIFAFDTNGLLNLYRYTPESRDNLLKVLNAIKYRVWMPHQVAYEYHDNRVGVIITQREMYSALKDGVDEAIKALSCLALPGRDNLFTARRGLPQDAVSLGREPRGARE
jgi:hypothetical protein